MFLWDWHRLQNVKDRRCLQASESPGLPPSLNSLRTPVLLVLLTKKAQSNGAEAAEAAPP